MTWENHDGMTRQMDSADMALQDGNIKEAMARGTIEMANDSMIYSCTQKFVHVRYITFYKTHSYQ